MFYRSLFAAVAVSALALSGAASATTFNFLFDNSGGGPDGTIGAPVVGVGTFTTPDTLTPGLYALTDLSSFTMSYSFADGESYSTGDIATPIDGVALNVTTYGSGLRMVWTEVPGSPDADAGPLSGSLDLFSGGGVVSFEPSYFGGNNLYEEQPGGFFGNYLATTVPEPAAWAMMIAGMGLCGAMLRRRQRALTAA